MSFFRISLCVMLVGLMVACDRPQHSKSSEKMDQFSLITGPDSQTAFLLDRRTGCVRVLEKLEFPERTLLLFEAERRGLLDQKLAPQLQELREKGLAPRAGGPANPWKLIDTLGSANFDPCSMENSEHVSETADELADKKAKL